MNNGQIWAVLKALGANILKIDVDNLSSGQCHVPGYLNDTCLLELEMGRETINVSSWRENKLGQIYDKSEAVISIDTIREPLSDFLEDKLYRHLMAVEDARVKEERRLLIRKQVTEVLGRGV